MAELWQYGASELAEGIAHRRFSASEVVAAHLARIDQVNPELNAVVRVLQAKALAAARKVDHAVATGAALGPLAGVPVTVKENIDQVGTPTTQGVPTLAAAMPAIDAPVVERILSAGAIPIGRTNMPDFGLRLHTDSALHGATRNPWDATRTTGGSSGGEAAALATGMSPLGLGNDLGGSLRNPASCCGVASLKPTQGVVPHAATIPIENESVSMQLMATDGPMARRIADVRLAFEVLRGWHPRDPWSAPTRLNPVQYPLRIAVMPQPPGGDVDPRIADLARHAAAALQASGCQVEETEPPEFEAVCKLWSVAVNNDLALTWPSLAPLLSDDAIAFVTNFKQELRQPGVADYTATLVERIALAREWARFFKDHDVLLSPTWTQLPFPVGWDIAAPDRPTETMRQARCVMPANALGLPSACVPAGLVDAMPVGVLLTGARFNDLVCLKVAAMLEATAGVATPIDPR